MKTSQFTKIGLLVLLCFQALQIAAQPKLSGHIYYDGYMGKEVLPGANIYELDTDNGTVTNEKGYFELLMNEPGQVNISFIGFENITLVVESDTILEIEMEQIEDLLICPVIFFRTSHLGLNYAIGHNAIGVDSRNTFFYGLGMQLNLQSDIKWRTDGRETYVDLKFRRFSLLQGRNFHGGLQGGYKRIHNGYSTLRFITIAPEIDFRGYIFSMGYTRGSWGDSEQQVDSNGLSASFQKQFSNMITLQTGGIFWGERYPQYYLNLLAKIPNSRFSVGAGYEDLVNWHALDLSVLYRFNY
jgi:hypothetical protein